MTKTIFAVLILIFVAAALTGCFGGSVAPAAPSLQSQSAQEDAAQSEPIAESEESGAITIEPEQLLSQDEVSALLGVPVKEAEKTQMTTVGQSQAFYDAQETGLAIFLSISISQPSTMPPGSSILPSEIYGSAKSALAQTIDLPVSDIGDDCFSGTPGLHILYEGYYIVIGAGNSDDEKVRAVLIEAGKLAVTNLQALLS